jgi:hypothetical protein
MELSIKQKAELAVFYVCSAYTTGEIQQDVHKNFAKRLATIKVDGFKNIGDNVFVTSAALAEKAKAWYADSVIKAEADKIFKQFGN